MLDRGYRRDRSRRAGVSIARPGASPHASSAHRRAVAAAGSPRVCPVPSHWRTTMTIVTRNAARLIRAAVFAGLASFAVAPAAHAAKNQPAGAVLDQGGRARGPVQGRPRANGHGRLPGQEPRGVHRGEEARPHEPGGARREQGVHGLHGLQQALQSDRIAVSRLLRAAGRASCAAGVPPLALRPAHGHPAAAAERKEREIARAASAALIEQLEPAVDTERRAVAAQVPRLVA